MANWGHFPKYWHTNLLHEFEINDLTKNLKLYTNVHDTKFTQVTAVTITVEALVRRHPRDAKMVSVTGAGRLRESRNTGFAIIVRSICEFFFAVIPVENFCVDAKSFPLEAIGI